MLRTVPSLPLAGLSTLGFDSARFQTEPPVCYRASWQLPGPDFHRQATTSTNTKITSSRGHLLFCWAHERSGLRLQGRAAEVSWVTARGTPGSEVLAGRGGDARMTATA